MTLESTTRSIDFTSGTELSVTFPFLADEDLVVVDDDGAGTVTTLSMGEEADYTVSGAGNPTGGTVTLASAITEGHTVTVSRTVALTQETDLRNSGRLLPSTIETALDKVTMALQQVDGGASVTSQALATHLGTWQGIVEGLITSALGSSLEEMIAEAVEAYLEEHPAGGGSCRTIWFLDYWDGPLDGSEDATTAINTAVLAAKAAGAELVFPSMAKFLVSDEIDITGARIKGGGICQGTAGTEGTTFYFSAAEVLDAAFSGDGTVTDLVTGIEGCTIDIAELNAAPCVTDGIRFEALSRTRIADVKIIGAANHGVHLDASTLALSPTFSFQQAELNNVLVDCDHTTSVGVWAYSCQLDIDSLRVLAPSGAGVFFYTCLGHGAQFRFDNCERWICILEACTMSLSDVGGSNTNAEYAGLLGGAGCAIDGLVLGNGAEIAPETSSRAIRVTGAGDWGLCRITGANVTAAAAYDWATANVYAVQAEAYQVDGWGMTAEGDTCALVVSEENESEDIGEFLPA